MFFGNMPESLVGLRVCPPQNSVFMRVLALLRGAKASGVRIVSGVSSVLMDSKNLTATPSLVSDLSIILNLFPAVAAIKIPHLYSYVYYSVCTDKIQPCIKSFY